jgi:hypothetical protein
MKKSAHQIWTEAKEQNLNPEEFKYLLKKESVIVNRNSDERWINVKHKLPKDGDHIIFGANNICDMQDRLCKPMVMAGWFMAGRFYSYLTKETLRANFWMPMPILNNGL